MADYVPRKGDLIALTFDPQSGHEQRGRRPALVVSNDLFNKHTGLCIACPITNTDRGYPFHCIALGAWLEERPPRKNCHAANMIKAGLRASRPLVKRCMA